MADRFITIQESDLGAGIDQQSSENRIQPGFAEDLLNMDPQATGSLKVRPGLQGYLGNIPLRVKSVEYNDNAENNICFFLDGSIDLSSIDLSQVRSTSIVVFGRVSDANSANDGDFLNTEDTAKFYTGFRVDLKKVFETGINTLTVPASEHPFSNPFLFTGVTRSTSLLDNSNEVFYPDSITVDKTTYDISVNYINDSGSSFEGFAYILDKSAVAGSSYVSPLETVTATSTSALTYSAVTHGLSNFNIIGKVYEDTGTSLLEVVPDSLTISTAGSVTVTITNSDGVDKDYYIVLTAAGALNNIAGSVAAGATQTIVIPEIEKDFLFAVPYLEQTIGGTLEQVYAESIIIDSADKTATVSFTNNTADSANFQLIYIYANIATNKLCVTGEQIDAADVYTDNRPQLVIYGLPHTEVYGPEPTDRQGFVSHIDSYRAAGEDRLVVGLGGNLFTALERGNSILDSYGLSPLYYPNIRGRLSTELVLGPAFYDSTDFPSRTRGYIQSSNGASGFLEVEAATYQAGPGLTRYTLTAPGLTVTGTLSDIISSTAGEEDYLTVKQMGNSRLNGDFKIKAVSTGADLIYIDVENPRITDSCFDEVDAGGFGGVFTEKLQFNISHPFLQGDLLSSELIVNLEVVASSSPTLLVRYITEEITLPAGLRFVGQRTTNILQLRDLEGTVKTDFLVRGDLLNLSGLDRRLRIRYTNPKSDEVVSVVGDGTSTFLTLTSSTTDSLAVGQSIILYKSDIFPGSYIITEILSETEFKIDSTIVGSESSTIAGHTVEVDESLEISDTLDSSIAISGEGRWVPIEAPISQYSLPEKTYPSHFDSKGYGNQDILRSVMVQDNMYFTNGSDEVMKYDGDRIYRAGLFRWQPHLYAAVDVSSAGKIDTGNFSVGYASVADNIFTLTTAADAVKYRIGQRIQDLKNNSLYTIVGIDETAGKLIVNRSILATGSGTEEVSTITQYSYYFRLNMVDRNNNVIGSAVTGAEDFNIVLAEDAAVNIRLIGMPVLDIYDYDRLEVQIYRTRANDTTNFFLLSTLPLSFNNVDGYLDYIDTDSDSDLQTDDALSVALLGAELATTISEPLRAKYITTAGNRLILGNVRDYPTIDLQFVQNQQGPITLSTFTTAGNSRYLIRKSNVDTGTVTNIADRIAYDFRTTSTAITSIANNSGSSFTVTATNTLSAGDWVYLYHSVIAVDKSLKYSGLFQVTSATGSAFTINFPHSAAYVPGASDVDRFAVATADSRDVPVFLGTDGNYNLFTGNRAATESYEFLAVKRLANMVNSSMRMVDASLVPTFTPYIIANAGGEFGFGQIVFKQPKTVDTNLEIVIPTLTGSFDVYVNSVKRDPEEEAGALTREFPSRLLVSYPHYPEIFDNPTAVVDSRSKSAIDVNSADGQELTSNIPFFGESAFGQASKSGIITVLKENSVYLADLSSKDALSQGLVTNTPVIQKLETEGKGCTAPLSVAVTRAGIMFANFSGIYRLNRSLEIEYIGRKIERIWKERVNKDNISLITAHHYANGNQYKISVPIDSDSGRNNQVLVYSHTREYEGIGVGSWTRYDSHLAVGWANLQDDAYMASSTGEVFSVRRTGDVSDFRDDSSPISWKFLSRALDFGDAGIRKNISSVITHYRTLISTDDISLKAALNMESQFNSTDKFSLVKPTNSTGLSDLISQKVTSIRSSLTESVGNYLQLQYSSSAIDKPVEISGIDIRVSGKDSRGIKEAADTTSKTSTN